MTPENRPFDVKLAMRRLSEATAPYPKAALMEELPRRSWVEINALLVPFGKHVCTGALPRCSTCRC